MIISNTLGFAFLHIPKCSGTSIRRALLPWDSYEGKWWGRETEPDGLELDLAHMTPETIRSRRPKVFAEIDQLERYAVLRDPEDRLLSSFNEHLDLVYRTTVVRESTARLAEMATDIEKTLTATPDPLPASLVHFTPQVRYLILDGRRYVPNVYRLDDLERLRNDLNSRHGTAIESFEHLRRRENVDNLRFRVASAEGLIWRTNALVWRYTPKPVHTFVKTIGRGILTTQKGKNTSDRFRESAAFRGLLERVYSEDLELWNSVQNPQNRSNP